MKLLQIVWNFPDTVMRPFNWFFILVRRLLSRLSCLSVQELRTRILAFIAYYNRTSNGAFHWTYKGLLRVSRLLRYFREAVLETFRLLSAAAV